jgi:hypothetical protein
MLRRSGRHVYMTQLRHGRLWLLAAQNQTIAPHFASRRFFSTRMTRANLRRRLG